MKRPGVLDLCQIAIFAALIALISQIVIPMPAGVPMTMQTLVIPFAGIVLGRRRGGTAALVYVLLGAVGMPVFQSFTGGAAIIAGPTGGFILSFPVMAWLAGWGADRGNPAGMALGLAAGVIVNFALGTIVYMAVTGSRLAATLSACVLPFILTAVIKALMAAYLGLRVRRTVWQQLGPSQ